MLGPDEIPIPWPSWSSGRLLWSECTERRPRSERPTLPGVERERCDARKSEKGDDAARDASPCEPGVERSGPLARLAAGVAGSGKPAGVTGTSEEPPGELPPDRDSWSGDELMHGPDEVGAAVWRQGGSKLFANRIF